MYTKIQDLLIDVNRCSCVNSQLHHFVSEVTHPRLSHHGEASHTIHGGTLHSALYYRESNLQTLYTFAIPFQPYQEPLKTSWKSLFQQLQQKEGLRLIYIRTHTSQISVKMARFN